MDTSDTVPTSDSMYKVISDNTVSEPMLWLNPLSTGTFTFYVRGTSIGGSKAYREVDLVTSASCLGDPPTLSLAE